MKASQILTDAREALVEHGWCQGVKQNEQGEMCVVGAMAFAEGLALMHYNGDVTTYGALTDKVEELGYGHVVDFNDDPHTTKQDVLNLFDKTIIGLEEKGL